VLLDYDREDGSPYAVGTYGGEMFDKFFEEFSFRLALEHRTADVRALVKETSQVVRLDEYCENQVLCG
jgi:arsenite oxidase small subunit